MTQTRHGTYSPWKKVADGRYTRDVTGFGNIMATRLSEKSWRWSIMTRHSFLYADANYTRSLYEAEDLAEYYVELIRRHGPWVADDLTKTVLSEFESFESPIVLPPFTVTIEEENGFQCGVRDDTSGVVIENVHRIETISGAVMFAATSVSFLREFAYRRKK